MKYLLYYLTLKKYYLFSFFLNPFLLSFCSKKKLKENDLNSGVNQIVRKLKLN